MTTNAQPPLAGQPWPGQGGIYAGTMTNNKGEAMFHVIVPTDPCADRDDIEWGGYGKREAGADSRWDGMANTASLAESRHEHPAARWARGLEIDGFTDWYLPSQRELSLCWATVPHLFEKSSYWSSTQYSLLSAWYQLFANGRQGFNGKGNQLRARAVRRFLIT